MNSSVLIITSATLVIVYLAAWFLLPVTPAFLFFKLLPNKAVVNGPFKGLRIDLGGAFAGYFLLFITAMPFMSRLIKLDGPEKEKPGEDQVWTITGTVLDKKTGQIISQFKNPRVIVYPLNNVIGDSYQFSVAAELKTGNYLRFPRMTVEADGYVVYSLEQLDFRIGNKPGKKFCNMDCSTHVATFNPVLLSDTNQKITNAQEDKN